MKLTINIGKPCQYAMKRMDKLAIKERRRHIAWAVVHPGHAGFPTLFNTKAEADKFRREHASAYVVCRVAVVPLYGKVKK